jgi:hypothetical protein
MVTTLPRTVAITSADDHRLSLSTMPERAPTKPLDAKVREQAVAVTRRKTFIRTVPIILGNHSYFTRNTVRYGIISKFQFTQPGDPNE